MSRPIPSAAEPGSVEGQHEHTVDGKGRVSIPSEFRDSLELDEGSTLTITRHLKERCLLVYWPAAWDAFKARLEEAPPRVASALRRVVCGTARKVRVDRLGRIQIPLVLRKYADLDGKCFVNGQGSYMEIWSMGLWDLTHGPEVYADLDLSEFDL